MKIPQILRQVGHETFTQILQALGGQCLFTGGRLQKQKQQFQRSPQTDILKLIAHCTLLQKAPHDFVRLYSDGSRNSTACTSETPATYAPQANQSFVPAVRVPASIRFYIPWRKPWCPNACRKYVPLPGRSFEGPYSGLPATVVPTVSRSNPLTYRPVLWSYLRDKSSTFLLRFREYRVSSTMRTSKSFFPSPAAGFMNRNRIFKANRRTTFRQPKPGLSRKRNRELFPQGRFPSLSSAGMDLSVKIMEIRQSRIFHAGRPFSFLMPQAFMIRCSSKWRKNCEIDESASGFLHPTAGKIRAIKRPSFDVRWAVRTIILHERGLFYSFQSGDYTPCIRFFSWETWVNMWLALIHHTQQAKMCTMILRTILSSWLRMLLQIKLQDRIIDGNILVTKNRIVLTLWVIKIIRIPRAPLSKQNRLDNAPSERVGVMSGWFSGDIFEPDFHIFELASTQASCLLKSRNDWWSFGQWHLSG